MKKLNITKEQFNRSCYFQRKYGKLEYVSESGKLFKTNKGEVLRFKESRTSNWEEVDLVWNSESDLLPDTIFVQVNQGSPSEIDLKYELEKRYDAEIIDIDTYPVSGIDSLCDCFKWTGDKLKSFNPSRITGKELQANWESTRRARRSARRFNENRVSQGTGNKELDKLIRFNSKVNSIHDQLEQLISKYWSDAENDPDMETYIDLLEEAEQKLLRVSADLYERIHMG